MVCQWDVLDVRRVGELPAHVQVRPAMGADGMWMATLLLAPSKLEGLSWSNIHALRDKILACAKLKGYDGAFPPSSLYKTWLLDLSYRRMIAAIDMFFTEFKHHSIVVSGGRCGD